MYRASAIETPTTLTYRRRWPAYLGEIVRRAWSAYRDRHRLERLSDHELRDIGLYRSEVDNVVVRSWDETTAPASLEATCRHRARR